MPANLKRSKYFYLRVLYNSLCIIIIFMFSDFYSYKSISSSSPRLSAGEAPGAAGDGFALELSGCEAKWEQERRREKEGRVRM